MKTKQLIQTFLHHDCFTRHFCHLFLQSKMTTPTTKASKEDYVVRKVYETETKWIVCTASPFQWGLIEVTIPDFLTDCSFKRQIFGTRVKLSFQLTPMANQSYPYDSLMCGVKLGRDDHSLRFGRLLILAKFWLLCSSMTA